MAYQDLLPVGTALIICATSFGLGVIYSNLPYDFNTLWTMKPGAFETSMAHYAQWVNAPMRVHHILHVVIGLGLSGCFIKLFKPDPEVKYFEYGTLGLMMVGVVIYLTNLRIGANSCISGQWGEVDPNTGINVMAASQFMIVIVLVGVLVLQGGLYYAQWYDQQLRQKFYEEEKKRESGEKPQETQPAVDSGVSSATAGKKTHAKKRV